VTSARKAWPERHARQLDVELAIQAHVLDLLTTPKMEISRKQREAVSNYMALCKGAKRGLDADS
jgi:hypothetical protein